MVQHILVDALVAQFEVLRQPLLACWCMQASQMLKGGSPCRACVRLAEANIPHNVFISGWGPAGLAAAQCLCRFQGQGVDL